MTSRLLAIALLAAVVPAQDRDFALRAPTAETFAAWHRHILPTAAEHGWSSLPWLPSFSAGLLAATKHGKPLLFYAMNGHPLGCT